MGSAEGDLEPRSGRGADSPGRIVVVSAEAFPGEAARILAAALRHVVSDAGGAGVSLALAGGSTPRPVYERLADEAVPWDAVEVYFGDERCVPPEDPASNYRMARETLLDRIPFPASRVHRIACESGDPDAAADRYAALLPDPLDVLVLGIGEDGHTASLFPGGRALEETDRRVAPGRAPEGQGAPRQRVTVTPPVIRSARRIVVLAEGSRKAAAVHRALEEPWNPAGCPAQLARSGTWILDRAAAASLRTPGQGEVRDEGTP